MPKAPTLASCPVHCNTVAVKTITATIKRHHPLQSSTVASFTKSGNEKKNGFFFCISLDFS